MGQLQERHDHAERDLATARHDIGTLTAERDHLANQVCVCGRVRVREGTGASRDLRWWLVCLRMQWFE
jgi:hypothetical protein